MIIGISGKKQSGKDTVAKIIQYHSAPHVHQLYPLESWLSDPTLNGSDFSWKIVKFADKLKQIVCLLTGCTTQQLEDEAFKNSLLGPEWEKVLRHESQLGPELRGRYTYREVLQIMGTDLLRKEFHENTWVNATMADYKPKGQSYESYGSQIVKEEYYPNWIITDVRFPNEVKAIKDKGGLLIRVNRNSLIPTDFHLSEIALDNYKNWDYVINNDGSLEELIAKIIKIYEDGLPLSFY